MHSEQILLTRPDQTGPDLTGPDQNGPDLTGPDWTMTRMPPLKFDSSQFTHYAHTILLAKILIDHDNWQFSIS